MDRLIRKYYFSCSTEFHYLNTPYCGTFAAKPYFLFGPNKSDKYILSFIMNGKGVYTLNNRSYTLKAGSSYIIFPDTIYSHRADKDDPWEYCWFEVYGETLEEFLKLSHMTPDHPVHEHTDPSVIKKITYDILDKYNTNNIQCELYRISLLHFYFSEMINEYKEIFIDTLLLENVKSNKFINKAINFITANYANDISIIDIANHVGLDRSYFNKLFKKITNRSPSAYLTNYRMGKAKYLFMYSTYKIKEIAKLVGYKNEDQFTRMFSSSQLITPSEYRKQRLTSFSTISMQYE